MRIMTGYDVVPSEGLTDFTIGLLDLPGRPDSTRVTVGCRVDPDRPEGSYLVTVPAQGAVTITGGPFSGVVYGVRELLRRTKAIRPGEYGLEVGNFADEPAMAHRTFFTWDHSTNWDVEQAGQQETGALNTYQKAPEAFLSDYTRAVDFASENRISALTVYGLLRDIHGGADAARTLCTYAAERGVRIIAGVGINSYGGIYFDGDHPFNLATWLRQRPELAAQLSPDIGFHIDEMPPMSFPRSEYALATCPSRPENLEWNAEAIRWLVRDIGVGGINWETGDYGQCQCADCRATALPGSANQSWSYQAMARSYPRLLDEARAAARPGQTLWNYIELYWDGILDVEGQRPIADLPDDAIYQYCVNKGFWEASGHRLTRELVSRLPHPNVVLRTHAASQWNRQRYAFAAPLIADMAARAGAAGMNGMTLFAEPSPYHPTNEFGYLALSRFTWSPDLPWDQFWAEEVAPRLGGVEAADHFVRSVALVDDPGTGLDDLDRVRASALDGAAAGGEAGRRWLWLAERASRAAFNRQTR
jgi:hypothetical protein